MTDEDLVQRTRHGDQEAFGLLVEQYRDAIFGLAYHQVGNFEDARDIAQESFIKAYLNLSQLREESKFGPWLRQITVNECKRWQRGRVELLSLEELQERPEEPTVEEDTERLALRLTVQKALACLSEDSRLTVTLFYVDGYSYKEIAGFLEVPVTTVKSRLRNARARLKKEMMQMVEETLKSEKPPEGFTAEVVQAALERAKAAQKRWDKAAFRQSCDEALAQLSQVRADDTARPLRYEVLHLLGDAEASWLGEPAEAIAHYEEALMLARQHGEAEAEAKALQALYQAHLRHGQFDAARRRAGEAMQAALDWMARGQARAAVDLAEVLPGRWRPGEPGGYAFGVFPLERTDAGWAWQKPAGEHNVSWGCPNFTSTFAHLWRYGPLGLVKPEVGQTFSLPFKAEFMYYTGWSPGWMDQTEAFQVVTTVESLTDRIVTPAGTFEGCLRLTSHIAPPQVFATTHVARTFAGTLQTWFAPGVGLVKLTQVDQNDSLRTVHLVACDVPDGRGYFPTVPGAWWRYRWLRLWDQKGAFEDLCRCLGKERNAVFFSSASFMVDFTEEQVREYLMQRLPEERAGDDWEARAYTLVMLGDRMRPEDPNCARAYYEEARSLHEQGGDVWGQFQLEWDLAAFDRDLPPEEKLHWAVKQVELARQLGHRRHEASALEKWAGTCEEVGRAEEATAHYEAAAQIYGELGDVEKSAVARTQAELLHERARWAESELPVFCCGVSSVIRKEEGLASTGSSSWQVGQPWPPSPAGSPMTHFVDHGFYQAFTLLPRAVGARDLGATGLGLPTGGCEILKVTKTLLSESESVTVAAGPFDHGRLVEVMGTTSEEWDTVEEKRAYYRGYYAGTARLWFAPGVGCVRTEYHHRNGLTTEIELVEYTLAKPSQEFLPLALGNRWRYRWTDPASRTRFEDAVFVAAQQEEMWWLGFVTAAWATA